MTKSGLIEIVAEKLPHLGSRDLEIVVNTMFDSMTSALVTGDRVEIRGFGSFSVRHRRAREGRNPKTGVAISVPAKRVPFFTVGNELRRRVNEGTKVAEVTSEDSASPTEMSSTNS
jgi:integration host factor beta subunit